MFDDNHNSSLVSLSIPKEVSQPIVAAKIQEAVLAALGGSDKIVANVIKTICETQVSAETGKTPQYSSDKKISWIEYHVTTIIQKQIEEEIKKQLVLQSETIKQALVKQLQSVKGANMVAQGIIDGLNGTFQSQWMSKVEVSFTKRGG